jgi:hypothetical protein
MDISRQLFGLILLSIRLVFDGFNGLIGIKKKKKKHREETSKHCIGYVNLERQVDVKTEY